MSSFWPYWEYSSESQKKKIDTVYCVKQLVGWRAGYIITTSCSSHPLVWSIAKSAGLIDNTNDFMIKSYIMKNVKISVKLTLKTNSRKGWANDDLRSFVQSVVISSMPSTQEQVEDKDNGVFVSSSIKIADTIWIPKTSFLRIRKQNQSKRDLLQNYKVMVTAIPYQQELYFLKLWNQRDGLKSTKNLKRKSVHSLKTIQMLYRVRWWMIIFQWKTKLIHQ